MPQHRFVGPDLHQRWMIRAVRAGAPGGINRVFHPDPGQMRRKRAASVGSSLLLVLLRLWLGSLLLDLCGGITRALGLGERLGGLLRVFGDAGFKFLRADLLRTGSEEASFQELQLMFQILTELLQSLTLLLQILTELLQSLTLLSQSLTLLLQVLTMLFPLLTLLLHLLIPLFHLPALSLRRPHLRLRLGQGALQRSDVLRIRVGRTLWVHARSLSRKPRCNGYTYTAFCGTCIVAYRSPRLRPRVSPTSTQLLAA